MFGWFLLMTRVHGHFGGLLLLSIVCQQHMQRIQFHLLRGTLILIGFICVSCSARKLPRCVKYTDKAAYMCTLQAAPY